MSSLRWPLTKSTRGMVVPGVAVHRRHEHLGDRCEHDRGGHRLAHLPVDVVHQPGVVLQLRDVDVDVHPVDALNLEDDMIGQDIGHAAR